MELDKWQENTNIVIGNINVERVQSFQYLGAMFTTNGDGASNIKQRLAMAVQALNKALFTPVPVRVPVPFQSRSTRSCSVHTWKN